MPALIRVTDESPKPELFACMGLQPHESWTAERETLIDTLWAEVLARRGA